jgi:hypothetical protein
MVEHTLTFSEEQLSQVLEIKTETKTLEKKTRGRPKVERTPEEIN